MKKISVILLIVFTLSALFSCGAASRYAEAVRILDSPYTASVRIAENGQIYEAAVVRDGTGKLEIGFLEPSLLCGISYGFDEENCSISYGGISVRLEDKNTKDKISSGVYIWRQMLEPDEKKLTGRKVKDGENTYTVVTDGKAEYKFDAETGKPLLITYGDTVISFTEFEKNVNISESTG